MADPKTVSVCRCGHADALHRERFLLMSDRVARICDHPHPLAAGSFCGCFSTRPMTAEEKTLVDARLHALTAPGGAA